MHDSGSVNVWPGYVAAISCLVLSLLLLSSIVVVMISQLGQYAQRYNETLVQKAIANKKHRITLSDSQTQAGPNLGQAAEQNSQPQIQLRLIFASDLIDIPLQQQTEVANSLHKLDSSSNSRWQIWAFVSASDALARHSTFRLMVAVRSFMVSQGISEGHIQLKLWSGDDPVRKVKAGEIAIYLAPLKVSGGT